MYDRLYKPIVVPWIIQAQSSAYSCAYLLLEILTLHFYESNKIFIFHGTENERSLDLKHAWHESRLKLRFPNKIFV